MTVDPMSGMVDLPGGSFLMGSDDPLGYPADGEGPVREVVLSPFQISSTTVTNDEFGAFVEATGHATTAESEGWSFVFAGHLPDNFPETRGVVSAPWWRQVFSSDWCHPLGPDSGLTGLGDHPVVHVSWFDAAAFADWAGGRLPTEAEWEFAARGGLEQVRLPWGDELSTDGQHRCNIWTGTFPIEDTAEDGFAGTCPVGTFEPNGYGLFNCSGNVWEWCVDHFSSHHPVERPIVDPTGPQMGVDRIAKGGSFLCHDSYCNRYRVGARLGNTPDSSTAHQGFRLAT